MQKQFPDDDHKEVQDWFDTLKNEKITTVRRLQNALKSTWWGEIKLPGAVRDTLQKAADTSTGAPFIPLVLPSPP
jgi:hypothetical protein